MLASLVVELPTHAPFQNSPSAPSSTIRPKGHGGHQFNSSFVWRRVLVMLFAEVALCHRTGRLVLMMLIAEVTLCRRACAFICLGNLGRSFITRRYRILNYLARVINRVMRIAEVALCR